ncbi:hypothetical protein GQ600_26186 [Phytophthora cactorum]|nr:hypothetical protein GQ600_26186 [Phytophthora cactorum]
MWTGEAITKTTAEPYLSNCASRAASHLSGTIRKHLQVQFVEEAPSFEAEWRRMWWIMATI